MVHVRNWNTAYEALPADSAAASQGANRIRDFKTDIRERLDLDHIMDEDTTNDGRHRAVHLVEQSSDPGNLADKGILYTKDVGGVTELFYRDSGGNLFQLTDVGKLLLLGTNNSWLAGQATTEVNVTFATPVAFDASLSNAFRITLTGALLLNKPTNMKSGQVCSFRIIQDGTGGRILTIGGSEYNGNTSDDLVLSTGANDVDLMTIYYDGTDHYILNLKKDIGNAL